MILYKNGISVGAYESSYSGKNILVSIDSSKSNSAMFVWDEYGHPLDDYEINGEGSEVEVYDLCWRTRENLKELFKGSKVLKVYIEDIITKKEKAYKGLEIHQSRAKITAVFNNFIFFFQDYQNIMPTLVNNNTWKVNVLPEEYRHRDVGKGSKAWCEAIDNRYGGRKDDVTDAFCIGLYMFMTEHIESTYPIGYIEPAQGKYKYLIVPEAFPIPQGSKQFVIQNKESLEHNAATVSNRIAGKQNGVFYYPVNDLQSVDVYSDHVVYNDKYKFDKCAERVLIVVSKVT
jgi:hypothetical protein